jgi:hypothetical protein
MTLNELQQTHPDYDAYIAEWNFFIRSYLGGKMYREGDYLLQHPFESTENYNRRKEIAYFYNYCAPIIDIYVSHLYKTPPKRDYGDLKDEPLFESFLKDSDLEGSTFSSFMRNAQRLASVYGRVSVVIDKPLDTAQTKADELENDIRPYLSLVTPDNVLDWEFEREPSGRQVLKMVKIKESKTEYRIWTRLAWELWIIEEGEKESKAVLMDSGTHGLGIVPVVNVYNKSKITDMIGVSDIQDIADINKNIYYLCSDSTEIIENTAFPMLAVPYEKGSEQDKEVGPRNILQFDPEQPNAKPFFIEAPHSSLAEIREWIMQSVREIHRIARLGGLVSTTETKQPWSGIALEIKNEQLYAALIEKADNMEEAETKILNVVALWLDTDFDGNIDYPENFSISDVNEDFERAIRSLTEVTIPSKTFIKQAQKKIANSVVPKAPDDIATLINAEIEAADGDTGDGDDGQTTN